MSSPGIAMLSKGGIASPSVAKKRLRVRLTHLDGKLPNLALMRLAAYHRIKGDEVVFTRNAMRDMFEGEYDRVYGAAIFTRSAPLVDRLTRDFPGAIIGGTGTGNNQTVEEVINIPAFEFLDYSIYPTRPTKHGHVPETRSFGFVSRGCRFACGHCVVPQKEGRPRASGTIGDIYRGGGLPRQIVLLDNDFFGVSPVTWRARIAEIRDGDFKVSFNQGINVRVLPQEQAEAIASVRYYNNEFTTRTIYTAFDSVGDERVFRRGIERLIAAGVRGEHIMSYMLVGYDDTETWESIFRRLSVMREYGIRPYPMPYQSFGDAKSPNAIPFRDLKAFQKFIVRRHYHKVSWEEFLGQPEGRRRNLHNQTRRLFADVA